MPIKIILWSFNHQLHKCVVKAKCPFLLYSFGQYMNFQWQKSLTIWKVIPQALKKQG